MYFSYALELLPEDMHVWRSTLSCECSCDECHVRPEGIFAFLMDTILSDMNVIELHH